MGYSTAYNPTKFAQLWADGASRVLRLGVFGDSRLHIVGVNTLADSIVAAFSARYGVCPATPHLSYSDYANVSYSLGSNAQFIAARGASASALVATNRPPTMFATHQVYNATRETVAFDYNRSLSPHMMFSGANYFDPSAGCKARLWFLTKSGSSNVTVTHENRLDAGTYNNTPVATYTTDVDLTGTGDGQLVSWTSPLLAYNAGRPYTSVGLTSADQTGATGFELAGWQWINPSATAGVDVDFTNCSSGYAAAVRAGAYAPSSIMATRNNAAYWATHAAKGFDAYLIFLGVNDAGLGYTAAEYAAGVKDLIDTARATMAAAGKAPLFIVAPGPYRGGLTGPQLAALNGYYAACCTTFATTDDVKVIDFVGLAASLGCVAAQVDTVPTGTPTIWATATGYTAGNQVIYQSNGTGASTLLYRCLANHTSNAGNYPGGGDSGGKWIPVEGWTRDALHPTEIGSVRLGAALVNEMIGVPVSPAQTAATQLAADQAGAPAAKRMTDTAIGGVAGTFDVAADRARVASVRITGGTSQVVIQ